MATRNYSDKDRESKRLYYLKHKEKIIARNKQWRQENPDRVKKIGKLWRQANTEKKAASRRAWYEANREIVLARQAERYRQLADATLRSRFCANSDLQSRDVPDELLPIIRMSILIRRELRGVAREIRDSTTLPWGEQE